MTDRNHSRIDAAEVTVSRLAGGFAVHARSIWRYVSISPFGISRLWGRRRSRADGAGTRVIGHLSSATILRVCAFWCSAWCFKIRFTTDSKGACFLFTIRFRTGVRVLCLLPPACIGMGTIESLRAKDGVWFGGYHLLIWIVSVGPVPSSGLTQPWYSTGLSVSLALNSPRGCNGGAK